MLRLRKNSGSALASAMILASLVMVGLLSSVAPASALDDAGKQGKRNWPAVAEPVNLAILIQDDLVGNVSNEMKITRDFIRALPQGSQVMVGYITAGSLQVRQPFITDLQKPATLRIGSKHFRFGLQSLRRSPRGASQVRFEEPQSERGAVDL